MKPKTIEFLLALIVFSTYFKPPEWYFVLTDIFVTAGFAYITYLEIRERHWAWVPIFFFFTVFYNPIWPIHIHRLATDQVNFFVLFYLLYNMLWWNNLELERKEKEEKEEKEEKKVTTF